MNKIVCLVVLSALFVGALAGMDPQWQKEMAEATDACKVSESATDDDLAAFRNHVAPTSQTGKCMVGCVFERVGFMENGAFSRPKADEKAKKCPTLASKPEILAKILQGNVECEKEIGSGTDRCETGVKIMACMDKMFKMAGM